MGCSSDQPDCRCRWRQIPQRRISLGREPTAFEPNRGQWTPRSANAHPASSRQQHGVAPAAEPLLQGSAGCGGRCAAARTRPCVRGSDRAHGSRSRGSRCRAAAGDVPAFSSGGAGATKSRGIFAGFFAADWRHCEWLPFGHWRRRRHFFSLWIPRMIQINLEAGAHTATPPSTSLIAPLLRARQAMILSSSLSRLYPAGPLPTSSLHCGGGARRLILLKGC